MYEDIQRSYKKTIKKVRVKIVFINEIIISDLKKALNPQGLSAFKYTIKVQLKHLTLKCRWVSLRSTQPT